MKRREIVKNLTLAGATAAVSTVTSKQVLSQNSVDSGNTANPLIEWRMATSWPENLTIVFGAAQDIAKRVSELTNNRFKITVYPAGGIAPPLEILDVVQAGTTECGHTAGYYYVSKNPAFAFTTVFPFGLNAYQQMTWLTSGGGLEKVRKLYADYNVINFFCCSTGAQMGGWFKKEVKTVADLKGLKMRIPGLGGKVFTKLGVEVQTLPPAEIVPALERGGVDAAEWVGPYEDQQLGIHKVAPYYYYPGWHEPGTTYELIVNLNAWNRLPKSYQQALETATMEVHLKSSANYDNANRLALQELIASGTKLVSYTPEILTAAQQAASQLYGEIAAENTIFKEIYSQWQSFSQKIYQWNRINELSLSNFLASK
jgi:TRAP-type mannitol/chloroaromatic compound transport system substrate-binding protein